MIAAVCAAALLATRGQAILPPIMQGNRHTANMGVVVWSVWLLSLGALAMLARRRPYSVLDLWLIVTMCAWLFDIALSAALDTGRYDLGFYAGRIYGLFAASFILIVLLTQTSRLYVQLMKLRDSDRSKTEELRRLTTIDPLTGIANRRAFEEALDQEWRRMMRHSTPLSLLMIDVDYFKRFNDAYGHVAGDQCLRAVAQALAQRTRRAGELAARYGGEEFAVLLPQIDAAAARRLAELICQTVRELQIPHEGSAVASHVTISVGAACIAALPEIGRHAMPRCRDGKRRVVGRRRRADRSRRPCALRGQTRRPRSRGCVVSGRYGFSCRRCRWPTRNSRRRRKARDHGSRARCLELDHVGSGQRRGGGNRRCMRKVIDHILLDIFVLRRTAVDRIDHLKSS